MTAPFVQQGNIDLANRPRVKNADGSISTVRSMSFNEDGREILVPTVSDDGRLLTDQQAIDLYHKTGRHLGIFASPEAATEYAQRLHEQQALQIQKPPAFDRQRAMAPADATRLIPLFTRKAP